MIIVRREWLAKDGLFREARANAEMYRETFNPSSSWRIITPMSGQVNVIIVEEDYENLADSEEKWDERAATEQFGPWIEEWQRVAVSNSYTINYYNLC